MQKPKGIKYAMTLHTATVRNFNTLLSKYQYTDLRGKLNHSAYDLI